MIWFTSDPHYGHHNIISYMQRPFNSVTEMNDALIAKYNAVVQPTDTVYLLGDISFCDPTPIVNRLNGKKFLILGNHDQNSQRKRQLHGLSFGWIKDVFDLVIDKQHVWLSHYPHRSWPGQAHGAWHLHGHSHGGYKNTEIPGSLDVGVDCWDLAPVSYDTLKFKLSPSSWAMSGERTKPAEFLVNPGDT